MEGNYLQPPAAGPIARYSLAWASLLPTLALEKSARMGHPQLREGELSERLRVRHPPFRAPGPKREGRSGFMVSPV